MQGVIKERQEASQRQLAQYIAQLQQLHNEHRALRQTMHSPGSCEQSNVDVGVNAGVNTSARNTQTANTIANNAKEQATPR